MKWGILGAARIADKALIPAIRQSGGTVVAVGASSLDRAQAMAAKHGIERACEGYDAILEVDRVEAVYIPLANGLHFEWALACARAGKACLCEKPLVLEMGQAEALKEAFGDSGPYLQEAFMWRHHAQVSWLASQIALGALGDLKRVHGAFSFDLDRPDDYRWKASQGGGPLWDVGCYSVNAARLFFRGEPGAVSARAVMRNGDDAVDESAVGWLDFGEGRLATFSCSFVSAFEQRLTVVGTKGTARLDTPWLSVDRAIDVEIERENQTTIQTFEPMNAYTAMVQHFTTAAQNPARRTTVEEGGLAEDGVAQTRVMTSLLESARRSGAPVTIAR